MKSSTGDSRPPSRSLASGADVRLTIDSQRRFAAHFLLRRCLSNRDTRVGLGHRSRDGIAWSPVTDATGKETAQQRWDEVDRYITDLLVPEGAALEAVLRASEAAGLPPIAVTAEPGQAAGAARAGAGRAHDSGDGHARRLQHDLAGARAARRRAADHARGRAQVRGARPGEHRPGRVRARSSSCGSVRRLRPCPSLRPRARARST